MFATQDQDRRRAEAQRLTRHHHGGLARRLRRAAASAMCAAAALPLISAAGAQAATAATTPTYTPLPLTNGWANYGFGTAKAAAANINGIVHLKGAIVTPGNNEWAFTLPKADRPATYVYVPMDMCEATNGRLEIAPNGEVAVQAEGNVWSNAQCFTSLDGVTFAKSASSFTPLTLVGGWASYGSGTARPAARSISGIVHLRGAMDTTGANPQAFTLPAADRPANAVFVPGVIVNTCGSRSFRLLPAGLSRRPRARVVRRACR